MPVSSTPFAQLLPALTSDQAIIAIALAPNIVTLHIWLVALSIGTPFTDLLGHSLGTELSEIRLDRFQDG